jgi:hypothetical protein
MHIASRWLDVHLEVEFLLMQLEVIASWERDSHGTLIIEFLLWHIYNTLYIQGESRWYLDVV